MATPPIAHIFCQIVPAPPDLDWWHRLLTNPSDTFAAVLALLTAFLVIIGWLQSGQLKRSVEVAKDAAEAAKKAANSAVAGQRAWLKLDLELLGQLEGDGRGGLRIQLRARYKNVGNSPATDVQIWAAMAGTTARINQALSVLPVTQPGEGFSVFPDDDGVDDRRWATLSGEELAAARSEGFLIGHIEAVVVVRVDYWFAGGSGETRRAYRLEGPRTGAMVDTRRLPVDASELRLVPLKIEDRAF